MIMGLMTEYWEIPNSKSLVQKERDTKGSEIPEKPREEIDSENKVISEKCCRNKVMIQKNLLKLVLVCQNSFNTQ